MRHFLSLGALVITIISVSAQKLPVMNYQLDVSQNLDTFFVQLTLDGGLKKANTVFQFAATAPGTYQTMDIGRFVYDFKAFDMKGRELEVSHPSVNQYLLEKPRKVRAVTYKVAETFDTQVEEYPVYLMCGSSIENDHALINAHTVFGYVQGLQQSPVRVSVVGREGWVTGTALPKTDGYWISEDFDHLVDSPILTGELSYADTTIAGTQVELYTYSANDLLVSGPILADMYDMLEAANKFLIKLPVERYTFLYFFEPNPPGQTGAWEHSYSSEYVLPEATPTAEYMKKVTDIASHEFFHIVTPLNIHSEIIESFNFVEPTTSVHLWMYEGVTEWASHMLLYRGGVVDEASYLQDALANKILVDERYFDKTWSLKKLSDESFKGGAGAAQYANIYYRGSLVASLLDIRLLELSGGTSGLRELILDLIRKYGKGRPVSEATFFDDIAAMTFPEIRPFFNQFVLEANPLPYDSYFGKIGLELVRGEDGSVTVKQMDNPGPEQVKLFEAWSKNLPRE